MSYFYNTGDPLGNDETPNINGGFEVDVIASHFNGNDVFFKVIG